MKAFLFSIYLLLTLSAGAQTLYTIDCNVWGNPANNTERDATGYSINGTVTEYGGCYYIPIIAVAIIDSSACKPLNNCNRTDGQSNLFLDPDSDCVYDNNTTFTCRQ